MLLAHHLWDLVPRGSVADEPAWVDARDRALALAEPALRARWQSLAVNEQRVSLRSRPAPGTCTRRRRCASWG